MDSIFHKIPFLRLTLTFAIGIALGANFKYPLLPSLLILLILFLLSLLIKHYYRYAFEWIFGSGVSLLMIGAGLLFYQQYNRTPNFAETNFYTAMVLEAPQKKTNSYKTMLSLRAGSDNSNTSNEKILAYLAPSSGIKNLKAGQIISFNRQPQQIRNNGFPFGFDYKNYLARKKIYRQVYLDSLHWNTTLLSASSIKIRAEKSREKLLQIYRNQNFGKEYTEILSALTLGYKRELDKETKRIFAAAGAMHVLAVSGLHVGILFMLFSFLFGFLKKSKYGNILFIILSILLLWGYAFITGLSPSVMRAATMFSIVSIGKGLNRKAEIYNTLSVSALLLLIINPNNLFEVGFQLSYAAVFGIVFFQPRFAALLNVNNKILKWLWDLFTVSLAAQLATFPISAFYFSQFPSYFFASNFVVIPAAFLLIFLSIALLFSSTLPSIAAILALIIKYIIDGVYNALRFLESLPYSVLKFSISPIELLLLLSAFLFLLIFVTSTNTKHFRIVLIFCILFFGVRAYSAHQQYNSCEMYAYHHPQFPVLHFIHGKKNYLVSEQPIDTASYFSVQLNAVILQKRLDPPVFLNYHQPFEDAQILLKSGSVFFANQHFYFGKTEAITHPSFQPNFWVKHSVKTTSASTATIEISNFSKLKKQKNSFALNRIGSFHKKFQNQ